MSGFSAEWLALRAPADDAARSQTVLSAARAAFAGRSGDAPLEIWDLGSGTGASVAAFSELFPKPQVWNLVDYDAANLARAAARYDGPERISGVRVATHVRDLNACVAPWGEGKRRGEGADLITATALFDLVSPHWLQRFADALAEAGLPLLATLTFDGALSLSPDHALDDAMIAMFNAHQRGDKGFGPAAGPDAGAMLIAALKSRGYGVVTGDSAWRLTGAPAGTFADTDDSAMIRELLTGWAGAAKETGLADADAIDTWLAARLDVTEMLMVGHMDVFAQPSG